MIHPATEYRCPACSAPAGVRCHSIVGAVEIPPHAAREELAKIREPDDDLSP
jgi:hypothetical protein